MLDGKNVDVAKAKGAAKDLIGAHVVCVCVCVLLTASSVPALRADAPKGVSAYFVGRDHHPLSCTCQPARRAARLPLPRALLALTLPTPMKRANQSFSETEEQFSEVMLSVRVCVLNKTNAAFTE